MRHEHALPPHFRGTLVRLGGWREEDLDPLRVGRQCRTAVIAIHCPHCNEQHEHEWLLYGVSNCEDGNYREEVYAAGCDPRGESPLAGGSYYIRPWLPSDREHAGHVIDPSMMVTRAMPKKEVGSKPVDCFFIDEFMSQYSDKKRPTSV